MLSNSLAAGALAASYVFVLTLYLNPAVPLAPARMAPLMTAIGLLYVLHLTAAFYVILVAWQLLARELFSPAWISVTVLAWLGAAASAMSAALFWANLQTFAMVLEPETARGLARVAPILGVAALLFLAVGSARRRAPHRRGLWAAILVCVAAASVAGPVMLRGPGQTLPLEARPLDPTLETPDWVRPSHLTLIAIDAGSLELVTTATAQGRLPNFGRILDAGAAMHLATLNPTSAEAVWTAVATGKLPQKNGVRSAGIYRPTGGGDPIRLLPDYCFASGLLRFGLLSEEPYTAATVRARTLWGILSTFGVSVGVINWPLTYPAPAVRGYVISDVYARLALTTSGIDDPSLLYPPELHTQAMPIIQSSALEADPVVPAGGRVLVDRHQVPGRSDRAYDKLAQMLAADRPTQVTLVRFESLDPIGHYFLRYAAPSQFGDVTDEERRQYGAVLESHYALIDEAIGRAIATLGPDDLLLVVSGYGMEPLGLGKRLLERVIGDPEISGSHESAPDGFLLAYGAAVDRGRGVRRASVVDVVPTVLYFLGLPVGRDMDGSIRSDLFQQAAQRPITYIPTYER
jgi:hypothetical protein